MTTRRWRWSSMRLSSVSIASSPKSRRSPSRASAYASSTKSTPSSARRTTRSVLIAVSPTYWPTSPARSTSTRWPRRSSPIERYICASRRATVVLPVPGLPRKTRCCVVATSGSPASFRRACTRRNATSARTCSLTDSRPGSESSSAISSSSGRSGSGRRSASRSSSSPICARSCSPRAFSDSSGFGTQRTVAPVEGLAHIRHVPGPYLVRTCPRRGRVRLLSLTLLMVSEVKDTREVANELRPVLLRLGRQLRREIHSLGVSGGHVSLLAAIKSAPGITASALAERECISAAAVSNHLARLESAGLIERTRGDDDRRRVGLSLSAEGEKVLRSVRQRRTAWLARRLDRLTETEREAIEAAIEPLARLLEADAE